MSVSLSPVICECESRSVNWIMRLDQAVSFISECRELGFFAGGGVLVTYDQHEFGAQFSKYLLPLVCMWHTNNFVENDTPRYAGNDTSDAL